MLYAKSATTADFSWIPYASFCLEFMSLYTVKYVHMHFTESNFYLIKLHL